jgi:hypothetical protein
MKSSVRHFLRSWVLPFVDPRQLLSVTLLPRFLLDLRAYRRLAKGERVLLSDAYPCLSDRVSHTPFDAHYFYQGAWLARRLERIPTALHVDAGSSVMMVSVLSAQVPLVFVDYRPLQTRLPGILPVAGNLTALPFADSSLVSISSLHVIEHVGLGRYGDPIDPTGSGRAAAELQRVVSARGRLYVSVPVGRERVCFNAHRVFAPATIVEMFPRMKLESFSVVDDAGRFTENAALGVASALEYGCGMFEFTKMGA